MSRHRASSMIHMYGLNYCADHTNGLIYEYSVDIFTDNGDPIIKERDTADVHGGLFDVPGKTLFFDQVEFVIISGPAEVAGTGLGPQPIIIGDAGICGIAADLTQGQLLGTSTLFNSYVATEAIRETSPVANGVSFIDSNVVSFTAAFARDAAPDVGYKVHIIDVYDVDNNRSTFSVYMDGNGYIQIDGLNESGATLLDVSIKNNSASFADGTRYMIAGVIDLSSTDRREIFIDGTNVSENSAYVDWNTYTDGNIKLSATVTPSMAYSFGTGHENGTHWGLTTLHYNGTDYSGGVDSLSFVTFDDTCSLICEAVWDSNGYVRDPQKWEGWYAQQPQIFYGPSFWRNTGKTEPATYGANNLENLMSAVYGSSAGRQPDRSVDTILNRGIAGNTTTTSGTSLPPAPEDVTGDELVSPFWSNTGTWIDLSKLTQTTFVGMFGIPIDLVDFNKVVAVDKAALVVTTDSGNRLQIQDSIDCANAGLYITDNDGIILGSMIYDSTPNGDSVLVPTGDNYYVVIVSDTGNAQIKKWDSVDDGILP